MVVTSIVVRCCRCRRSCGWYAVIMNVLQAMHIRSAYVLCRCAVQLSSEYAHQRRYVMATMKRQTCTSMLVYVPRYDDKPRAASSCGAYVIADAYRLPAPHFYYFSRLNEPVGFESNNDWIVFFFLLMYSYNVTHRNVARMMLSCFKNNVCYKERYNPYTGMYIFDFEGTKCNG